MTRLQPQLGMRLRKIRREKDISQKELAAKTPATQALISAIEQCKTDSSPDTLSKIAEALDVPLSALLDDSDSFTNLRELNEENALYIKLIAPTYKACAGEGNGTEGVTIEYNGTVRIEDSDLSAYYTADSLTAMTVEGDSMEPVIYDGDTVIFTEQYEVTAQGMPYIVEFLGKLAVKGVETNKNGYLLRSANKNYEPRQITEEDNFRIIGRVVGISPKFKKPKPIY